MKKKGSNKMFRTPCDYAWAIWKKKHPPYHDNLFCISNINMYDHINHYIC